MSQLSSQFLKTPRYSRKVKLRGRGEFHLADPRASRALLCLMNMQAVMGGAAAHWGGPSAFAELASALTALVFSRSKNWFDHFHIINDAGHCENGLYALKANYEYAGLTIQDLKGFRSISSVLTGHGEAHLFPEGVYLSNGPLGSTLAQAQGLSLADRLRKKNRAAVVMISDGALMEGEAKEALASIPGLAVKGKMNPFLLIISDNNKKLSGPIDKESFSMSGTLSSLPALGWKTLVLDSPHDLEKTLHSVNNALEESLKDRRCPVALQAKTIKGYGLKETENNSSGGHGFPLKTPERLKAVLSEIYQGEKVPDEFLKWSEELMKNFLSAKKTLPEKAQKNTEDKFKRKNIFNLKFLDPLESKLSFKAVDFLSEEKKEKVQEGVSRALIKKFEQGFPLVSVSSDLPGSTGVAAFRKKAPQFSFDMGVSEANMISTAIGLSKQGFIPVVDTFAQFGVSKGILPLFMAGLSQAPVIAVFSHIGFQSAADGASHQCLTYFAQTGSLPHTRVYSLSSSEEAEALMEQAVESFHKEKKNIIFFLGREKFQPSYLESGYKYHLGRAQVVFSNFAQSDQPLSKKTCTLAAGGTLLEEAVKAARVLARQGWRMIVIHPSCINEPDLAGIGFCLSQTKGNILTIEDHQVRGGMASFLSHALAVQQVPFCMRSLGVEGGFGRSAYKALDLYRFCGLDSHSIVQAVKTYFS